MSNYYFINTAPVHSGSWVHSASYPMDIERLGGYFPGDKAGGA